ncbi:MAG: hypothetical protein E4H48_05505 [Syntrophobacterales bacterium]|nr:MAG: hypothetical protein E4H48_05505 [Syntrophobacterales bacterium]
MNHARLAGGTRLVDRVVPGQAALLFKPIAVHADVDAALQLLEVGIEGFLLLFLKQHGLDGLFHLFIGSITDHGLVGIEKFLDILLRNRCALGHVQREGLDDVLIGRPFGRDPGALGLLDQDGLGHALLEQKDEIFLELREKFRRQLADHRLQLGAGDLGVAGFSQGLRFHLRQLGVFQHAQAEAWIRLFHESDLGVIGTTHKSKNTNQKKSCQRQ